MFNATPPAGFALNAVVASVLGSPPEVGSYRRGVGGVGGLHEPAFTLFSFMIAKMFTPTLLFLCARTGADA
ncbi:hypothetical protein CSC64_01575 [Pseudoxanthomonas koreensis]|nr:hypothetical protein CSC64_01575 [Pseudoxanthomonas koreensis]